MIRACCLLCVLMLCACGGSSKVKSEDASADENEPARGADTAEDETIAENDGAAGTSTQVSVDQTASGTTGTTQTGTSPTSQGTATGQTPGATNQDGTTGQQDGGTGGAQGQQGGTISTNDLIPYFNRFEAIFTREAELNRMIEVSGDETFAEALVQRILPASAELQAEVEALPVTNPLLISIHANAIEGMKLRHGMLVDLAKAFEQGDRQPIADYEDRAEQSEELLLLWARQLTNLTDHLCIEMRFPEKVEKVDWVYYVLPAELLQDIPVVTPETDQTTDH